MTRWLAEELRLRDLKLLDVEPLARGVNMSAGHLSRQFKSAYG